MKDNKFNLSEDVAIQLNKKNMSLAYTNAQLDSSRKTIKKLDAKLKSQEGIVDEQANVERVRSKFNDEEAEVYQQSDRLIVKLKDIAFTKGSSKLPSSSVNTLSKVRDTIAMLPVAGVTVEGHADSTGTVAFNQKLSKARAETVVSYLKANGFDEQKFNIVG